MGWSGPAKSKDQIISEIKAVAPFESIGKTVQNNDIWLFRFGNAAAKLLISANIHGHEIGGAHNADFLAQWLVGGSPEAVDVLSRVQVLLVPIINYDSAVLGGRRKNQHNSPAPYVNGVDLNRNFVNGYGSGSTIPSDDYYMGPSFASEPETQVMRSLFGRERPVAYLDIHDWGGAAATKGDFRYLNTPNNNLANSIISSYVANIQQKGFTPHGNSIVGPSGFARDDGYGEGGAISALWEEDYTSSSDPANSETVTIDLIQNNKNIHLQAYVKAVAQVLGVPFAQTYVFDHWQDGDMNPTKVINV